MVKKRKSKKKMNTKFKNNNKEANERFQREIIRIPHSLIYNGFINE